MDARVHILFRITQRKYREFPARAPRETTQRYPPSVILSRRPFYLATAVIIRPQFPGVPTTNRLEDISSAIQSHGRERVIDQRRVCIARHTLYCVYPLSVMCAREALSGYSKHRCLTGQLFRSHSLGARNG